jgi:hypothetical protein
MADGEGCPKVSGEARRARRLVGGRSKDLAAPCMNDTEVKSVNEVKESMKQLRETTTNSQLRAS